MMRFQSRNKREKNIIKKKMYSKNSLTPFSSKARTLITAVYSDYNFNTTNR